MHVQGTVDSGANDFRERARARALRRASAAAPRALRSGAFIIALVLHLLGAVWLYFLMKPKPSVDRDRIEVRLLDAGPSVPPLPEPPPKAQSDDARDRAASSSVPVPAAPSVRAAAGVPTAQTEPSQALVSSARLFNPDGSVRLAPMGKPSAHEQGMQRAHELMTRGHNPLHCARGMLFPESGLSINERAAKAARKTRLMAFATQGPGVIQAQYDSQTNVAAEHTSDSTMDRLTMEGQACDDEFYRRPPPPKPEEKN